MKRDFCMTCGSTTSKLHIFWLLSGVMVLLLLSPRPSLGKGNERKDWPVLAADGMLAAHPHYINYDDSSIAWDYPQALIMYALWSVWKQTQDTTYFNYVKASVDFYFPGSGGIRTYVQNDFRLDDILMGRVILDLYASTKESKYRKAVDILREQLRRQPRNPDGGFWHKKIYPDQMWLDGLYMAEPFYAHYAKMFDEPKDFDDIANQFILMAQHSLDPKTGLMYHGWDFRRTQKWADPKIGDSQCFWGRALGWYMMGIVDVLGYFPGDNPERGKLISIFQNLCSAVVKYQDKKTHLWYQVVDQPERQGNYLESSATLMFAYSFAKGEKEGYLGEKYLRAAQNAFDGIVDHSVLLHRSQGRMNFVLENTSGGVGLGGKPYRDGSFHYYVSVPKESNDFRGVGPFILAALELESIGMDKEIGLDYYFNDEWKKDASGVEHRFHYIWEDTENSGYSQLGKILKGLGARITSVTTAPTKSNLDKLSVYMIVDPDTPLENPHPNYIDKKSIGVIVDWVRRGGVLTLFGNDSGNCEFTHLNRLSEKFGIRFNEDSRNRVQGTLFDNGAFTNFPRSPIFKGVKKIFLKEISTLKLSGHARSELTARDCVIMASCKFEKGFVFAVGDPWFYNEYMDHRRLPADFDNAKAARNLFKWLLTKGG